MSIAQTPGFSVGGHTKYRFTSTTFPADSLFRDLAGSSAEDVGLDARLNLGWSTAGWDVLAHAQFGAFDGDTVAFTRGLGDERRVLLPRLPGDERRWLDLTHVITDKGERAAVARLDRASFGYTGRDGAVRFGRQAITWGNGLIFNTVMDIFNPFDPAAIDKEYKSGDDLLYGQYLRGNGDDLQGVIVVRRAPSGGALEADRSSFAAKYRGLVGDAEYDLLIARHFADTLAGGGASRGIGGALWRGDLLVTHTRTGETVVSAVTSLSHSFSWAGRSLSAVAEYYFNGFGQRDARYGPADVAANRGLAERLSRGELFSLGRHYLGLSALIEITPLWALTPNLFANLGDPSALVQLAAQADLGDSMRLLGAVNVPVGEPGTEYGGIDAGRPARQLSSGPGVFVQFAWYF